MDWGWIGLTFVFVCFVAGVIVQMKQIRRTGLNGWTRNNSEIWRADAAARQREAKEATRTTQRRDQHDD